MSGEAPKEPRRFTEAFRGKQDILMNKIDIDHGLLTVLNDFGVLGSRQIEDIEVMHFLNFYRQELHRIYTHELVIL
jgi:hypothetical protein